jgi:hypothetical protein
MGDGDELISVDRDVLARSAAVLLRTAEGLAAVSHAIVNTPIGGTAFGTINSWMVAPIAAVSSNSAEHLRISGNVVEALASATDDAANDFETTENEVQAWVKQLDEQLDAGLAPLPPPAPASPASPSPTPSPSPGPSPTPSDGDSTP